MAREARRQSAGGKGRRRIGDHRVHGWRDGQVARLAGRCAQDVNCAQGHRCAHPVSELDGERPHAYGRPEDAIRYFDRALQLVRSTPELDTSTMAISGKARALVALGKRAEAEKLFQDALDLARRRNRRGLAASILPELGKMADEAGEQKRAITFYEEAVTLAEADGLFRLVATPSFGLARLYRKLGDLAKAEEYAAKGVEASQRVGETFELPESFGLSRWAEGGPGEDRRRRQTLRAG